MSVSQADGMGVGKCLELLMMSERYWFDLSGNVPIQNTLLSDQ